MDARPWRPSWKQPTVGHWSAMARWHSAITQFRLLSTQAHFFPSRCMLVTARQLACARVPSGFSLNDCSSSEMSSLSDSASVIASSQDSISESVMDNLINDNIRENADKWIAMQTADQSDKNRHAKDPFRHSIKRCFNYTAHLPTYEELCI